MKSRSEQDADAETIRKDQRRVQAAADELLRERLGPINVRDLTERTGLPEQVVLAHAKALWLRVELHP